MKRIAPLLLILSSCGSLPPMEETSSYNFSYIRHVDPELKDYVQEFITGLQERRIPYKIDFDSISIENSLENDDWVGVCYFFNRIEILRREISPIRLKSLVFHELGHCILKLGHAPEDSMEIMQPVEIVDSRYLETNWSSLVDNLYKMEPTMLTLIDDLIDHE